MRYLTISAFLNTLLGLSLILCPIASLLAQACPWVGQPIRLETFDNNFYTNLPIHFSTDYTLIDYRLPANSRPPMAEGKYTVGTSPSTVLNSWQVLGYNGNNVMMVDVKNYNITQPDPNQSNSPFQARLWTDTMRLQPGRQYEVRLRFRNAQSAVRAGEVNPYPLVSINGIKIPMTSQAYNGSSQALTPEATGYAPSITTAPTTWYDLAYKFRAPARAQPWHIVTPTRPTHTVNVWPKAAQGFNVKGNDCLFDDIQVVFVGDDAPGNSNLTVCGFGEQYLFGPNQTVAYNWYKNGQLIQASSTGLTKLLVNLTNFTTQYEISTTDPYGCQSPRSNVSVLVDGTTIYNETFDPGSTGGAFSSDYRLYNPYINTGGFGPGQYGIDHYVGNNNSTYNSGWAGTGTAGAVSQNNVMIVDAKNQIGGVPAAAWKKLIGTIQAGETYKIKFRYRNAYHPVYPGSYSSNPQSPYHYWDPIPSCYALGTENNTTLYYPLSSTNNVGVSTPLPVFVTQLDWTEVTYTFVAPTTKAYSFCIGTAPLTSYPVSNPLGNDSYIDDIRIMAYNQSVMPDVDPVARCGAGPVTLTVKNAVAGGAYEWRIGTATQYTLGTSSFTFTAAQNTTVSVRDVSNPLCLSAWRTGIAVQTLTASADFTVDANSGPAPYLRNYNILFRAFQSPNTLPNTRYRWDWGDGSPLQIVTSQAVEHAFSSRGTFVVKLTVAFTNALPPLSCPGETVTKSYVIADPLCETYVPLGGTYKKNTRSGAVEYDATCGPGVALECLSEQAPLIDNVVALTRTAYTDTLVQLQSAYVNSAPAENEYLQGRTRLRPYAVYGYQTGLKNSATNFNFEYGTFQARGFDWKGSARGRAIAWLPDGIVDFASPNGDVLQEHDLLGIVSTAKFGYGKPPVSTNATASNYSIHALPYLQAHNAEYNSVRFESFESVYGNCSDGLYGEDRLPLSCSELTWDSQQAHTGSASARMTDLGGSWHLTLDYVNLTTHVRTAGLVFKVWVKTGAVTLNTAATATKVVMLGVPTTGSNPTTLGSFPLTALTRTGEWTLYQAVVDMNTSTYANQLAVRPQLVFGGTAGTIWLDDVRFQPQDAQMTTYVYDPVSLRLLANFDDQHFPLLYQYNPEGKLIRKQIETERGIKTLQETLYHTATP